jgi:transporter family-2 protein
VELLPILLALLVGAGLPVQAGVNATAARFVGRPEGAALVNFSVGLAALLAWLLASGYRWPSASELARAPWWAWGGGVIGATYVAAVVLLVPRLGLATTLALTVLGQMASSLVLDHLGALGAPRHPVSLARVAGAALVVVGVVLVRR